jgi:hypothetical protein
MLKVKFHYILLLAAMAGCSHGRTNTGDRRREPAVPTCFRPVADPFVSALPPGMTVQEGLAKGLIGSLEKETIRQVIRRDHREVKACYERALLHQPQLAGRVTIQFVITGRGAVSDSRLSSSSLGSPETEICLAERACRWQFPATNGGGTVVVAYPFNFTSEATPEP